MARRTFKDRFLTPPVARAIMSPLGIVLFGAGTAGAILTGVPFVGAAAIGVGMWAARVLAAVPRDAGEPKLRPSSLAEPWKSYVVAAQEAKQRFDRVVGDMSAGPLRERLAELAARLEDGVAESWRIARRGNDITAALGKLDTITAQAELAHLDAQIAARPAGMQSPTAAEAQTIQALQSQLESANRLQTVAQDAHDRLRVLDARFDELVARAVEVSVGTGDTTLLGNDVDQLVSELESLRVALDETNRADQGPAPRTLPSP